MGKPLEQVLMCTQGYSLTPAGPLGIREVSLWLHWGCFSKTPHQCAGKWATKPCPRLV